MLALAPKPRVLCSSSFHLLSVPRVKTRAGTCALFSCFPCNSLEFTTEHLKSSLSFFPSPFKSHPFRLAYKSLLSFHCIRSFCIIPWLWYCLTRPCTICVLLSSILNFLKKKNCLGCSMLIVKLLHIQIHPFIYHLRSHVLKLHLPYLFWFEVHLSCLVDKTLNKASSGWKGVVWY